MFFILMTLMLTSRQAALRLLISEFLSERLNGKLDKLAPDDPKRAELLHDFVPAVWLEDAAKRAAQIQAVTHSLKPIHPDAKGSSLYAPSTALSSLSVVGSHCLGQAFAGDVVGNAAALDVYKFLKLEHEGQSLLTLALAQDEDLAHALSEDVELGRQWMSAFAGLTQPRGRPASHTLAKQLYWLVGDDVHDDAAFHLLAPLYASSLAHRVYEVLQDDRFSEASKAAREAKKLNAYSERPVREYPQMAIQQLGGTKPQNISQLNSERRGQNHLLASLPPVWRSVELKPLYKTDWMYHRFARRPAVKAALRELLEFLKPANKEQQGQTPSTEAKKDHEEKKGPGPNLATRNRRAALVMDVVDEFLQFTAELRSLDAGWSLNADCKLPEVQARWLDPEGRAQDDDINSRPPPTDVPERISESFANWLNAQLREPLPMGDPEFLAWRKVMWEAIKAEEREGTHVVE